MDDSERKASPGGETVTAHEVTMQQTPAADSGPEPAGFPPRTPADWRVLTVDGTNPIDPIAARRVYDLIWFYVQDQEAAARLTALTFRVALSRIKEGLPTPSAYTPWLAVIATNEAHRYLESEPTQRPASALSESASDRDALFLADAIREMRADQKLAMLLRYRYDVPPALIAIALDMRPRRLARLFVKARQHFAKESTLPPSMFAVATPPPPNQTLATNLASYPQRDLKPKRLGYMWLDYSGFPTFPERDERKAKWLTALVTALLLLVLAIGISRPWSAERPELVDPSAQDAILLLDG